MKIVTYNLNGIRSATSKGLLPWLDKLDADIVCFQEVRANEQVASEILNVAGNQLSLFANPLVLNKYNCIFNCGQVAGYAGTLVLTKEEPNKVTFGFDNVPDPEGRVITAYYNNFAVVNCYVPNGTNRLDFKMGFWQKMTNYLTKLKQTTNVIYVADANISHTEDDLSHPKECSRRTGFLPIEREALTNLLSLGFTDVARMLQPTGKIYTWRSYRSRMPEYGADYGWKYRFDYVLCNNEIASKFTSCQIPDEPYSDHLPVIAEINL